MTKAEKHKAWKKNNPDKVKIHNKRHWKKRKRRIRDRRNYVARRVKWDKLLVVSQSKISTVAKKIIAHDRRKVWQQLKKDLQEIKRLRIAA